jgi:hypothetical protein
MKARSFGFLKWEGGISVEDAAFLLVHNERLGNSFVQGDGLTLRSKRVVPL